MKKLWKLCLVVMMAWAMVFGASRVDAKTKFVAIVSLKGNTLRYKYASMCSDAYGNENVYGYGSTYKIKVTSKTKYYKIAYDRNYYTYNKKCTKSQLNQIIKQHAKIVSTSKSYGYKNGKGKKRRIYFYMAAKLTISKGKVTKVAQSYQA
ncbi:MAG: hypothetical protein ACSW8B_02295 [bacterium]